MIINDLTRYYELLLQDEKNTIPTYGYSSAKAGFALIITEKGDLVDVVSLKVDNGRNRLISRTLIVPEQKIRSSGITPNFMCDNSTYVLGIDKKGKPQRAKEAFLAFKKYHKDILEKANGRAARAVLAFLDRWDVDTASQNPILKNTLEELLEGSNIVFRLDGEPGFLHNDLEIRKLWEQKISKEEADVVGQCLITGEQKEIAKLHPSIKNVKGAQSSGATIVSFNAKAYESYGKENGYIAPISKYAAFAYTTVLNHMLANQKQKIQIGDTTAVFWADSPEEIYIDLAAELFNPSINQETNKNENNIRKRDAKIEKLVKDVLKKVKSGSKINEIDEKIDNKTKFSILGLSPNASRLSVRFYYSDTFGHFVNKIAQHYVDLEIVKDFDNRPDNIPIWMMLEETVSPKSRNKEASPLLAGAIMRAILNGTLYPAALFNSVMIRIRADNDDSNSQKINYIRAAIIKAYLLRKARITKNKRMEEDITVGLNENSSNVAYLLGRLFAVLEKAQQDANPGINATIKDRYFNSACATPAAVFPVLLRLAQHHISKSDYGYSIDKRLEQIMNQIEKFPNHLSLDEQGTFILGYYHQKVAFFQKSEK